MYNKLIWYYVWITKQQRHGPLQSWNWLIALAEERLATEHADDVEDGEDEDGGVAGHEPHAVQVRGQPGLRVQSLQRAGTRAVLDMERCSR